MISYEQLKIELKIKKLREYKGLSLAQMASQLNLSTRGYRNIEDGKTALTIERFIDICNILECTLEEFFVLDSKNIFNFNNQQGNQKLINQGVVNEKSLIDHLLKIKDDLLAAKDEIIASKNALIDQLQHKLNS
jgi:transcriptional regulator with XRE-family HTH domain